MDRIERIRQMEAALDAASDAIENLGGALEQYAAVREKIRELDEYYSGGEWLCDYDADRAGLLPPDLKRGVLSQDAVYDLLMEHRRLLSVMAQLINEGKGGSS